MELKVDSAKTYTYGDWVQGAVLFSSTDSYSDSVDIELRGTITLTLEDGNVWDDVYVVRKTVKFSQTHQQCQGSEDKKTHHFALQFPDCKQGAKIPSTLKESRQSVDVRHTLTVKTGKHKLLRRSVETSVELRFIASENIALLSAPRKVYDEHCHKGLSALAELSVPSYFAQGGVDHKFSIRLLEPKVSGLRLLNVWVTLKWGYFDVSGFLRGSWKESMLAGSKYTPVFGDATGIDFDFRVPECKLPTFRSTDIAYYYYLSVRLILFNNKTERCQCVNFTQPVDVLPELLYKNKPGCFATPEEICDVVAAGKGP